MSLARQLRRYRYLLGVVALVLVAVLVRIGAGIAVSEIVSRGGSTWLPQFGSVGRTVSGYLLTAQAFVVLVVPAVAFWLGYRHARVTE